MEKEKMKFRLQMSDCDGIYTRTVTSPMKVKRWCDYEYKLTFVTLNENRARRLKVGECFVGRSLRDEPKSKCIITRIE